MNTATFNGCEESSKLLLLATVNTALIWTNSPVSRKFLSIV